MQAVYWLEFPNATSAEVYFGQPEISSLHACISFVTCYDNGTGI